jgi:hypothetical protein
MSTPAFAYPTLCKERKGWGTRTFVARTTKVEKVAKRLGTRGGDGRTNITAALISFSPTLLNAFSKLRRPQDGSAANLDSSGLKRPPENQPIPQIWIYSTGFFTLLDKRLSE